MNSTLGSVVPLAMFPTMQPRFTKAIDGKAAKRLLFSGVLVLSTDLKVANVIVVVIIVNSTQIVTQNIKIKDYHDIHRASVRGVKVHIDTLGAF